MTPTHRHRHGKKRIAMSCMVSRITNHMYIIYINCSSSTSFIHHICMHVYEQRGRCVLVPRPTYRFSTSTTSTKTISWSGHENSRCLPCRLISQFITYISTPLLRQSASCIHRKIHTKFCGLDVNAVYTMSQQAKG